MTFGNYTHTYYNRQYAQNPQFRGAVSDSQLLSKPIEQVENVIHNTVDKFTPQKSEQETEEKRKSKKAAIKTLSSVLVVSGLVALLNPSFSNKMLTRINKAAQKASSKAQSNLTTQDKLYMSLSKSLNEVSRSMKFVNTLNATKDVMFTKLCKSQRYGGIKNDTLRKILQTINKWFTNIMSKAHNGITKGFDYVSKKTVFTKYQRVNSGLDSLDHVLGVYRSKLPKSELDKFDKKFEEIIQARSFFKKDETSKRLLAQQQAMTNLQDDFSHRITEYLDNFEGSLRSPKQIKKFYQNWQKNAEHFNKNKTFWAEEIVAPQREIINKEGKAAVDKLVGDGKGYIGKYGELMEIISPYISKEEKAILEDSIDVMGKRLRSANKSECMEYFDKKRDLMLGGAPTDIVTAATTLGVSGVLIGTADSKEDRVSRTLTMVIPAIAGVGVSFAMASALFSGTTSLLSAGISSVLLSKIGSKADEHFVQNRRKKNQEVVYA